METWITTYRPIGGWKAVCLTKTEDGFEFDEPLQTGMTCWVNYEGARKEAEQWAEMEGLELRLPDPLPADNEYAYPCPKCKEYGCLMEDDEIHCPSCKHIFNNVPSVAESIADVLPGDVKVHQL